MYLVWKLAEIPCLLLLGDSSGLSFPSLLYSRAEKQKQEGLKWGRNGGRSFEAALKLPDRKDWATTMLQQPLSWALMIWGRRRLTQWEMGYWKNKHSTTLCAISPLRMVSIMPFIGEWKMISNRLCDFKFSKPSPTLVNSFEFRLLALARCSKLSQSSNEPKVWPNLNFKFRLGKRRHFRFFA